MCFEIGNKVAVLDDCIRGFITNIKDGEIFVEDEEGMNYVFQASELIRVEEAQYTLMTKPVPSNFLKDKLDGGKSGNSVFRKHKNEVVMEVDLHAEKLLKSTRGLDNFDILNTQLEMAKHKLEYCIQRRISKIVFIHGVGEGVLKTELKYLFNQYPVDHYDASYQKYGLGATEVYVYQNS